MPRRAWTKAELARVRKEYPRTDTRELAKALGRTRGAVHQKARVLGLEKSMEFIREQGRRNVTKAFLARAFPKGHQTWNAGKKGYSPKGSEKGWFPKGGKPPSWKPVGSVRRDPDGYLWRKVSDTRNTKRDWKLIHVILWERHRGKIPRGKFLVFKDRNKENIRIGNLELVSRAEHMQRNTMHRLPKPLKDTIIALKVLSRRIKRNGKY